MENISTRHIANEMGISVGNLHYHYANKNEVIKALQARFLEKTDELIEEEVQNIELKSFTDYQSIVVRTFELIYLYRFLFKDRLTLYRKVPEIESMFREMLLRREKEFYGIGALLSQEGLLRTDLPQEQYAHLFKQVVMLYNSWGSHITLFDLPSTEASQIPAYFAGIVSSIWVPYFSEKGLKKFGLKEGA